jgi:hypothetical protein
MQWFQYLPVVIQGLIVIAGALLLISTTLSGLAKAFGWAKGVAFFASLGADFAKALAVLQGFLPQNKPATQVEQVAIIKEAEKKISLPPPPAGPLAALFIALFLGGCGSTVKLTSAVSADGINWIYCVEVTEPVLSTTASQLLCANDSAIVTQMQTEYAKAHPAATFGAVKQVPSK